MICPEFEKLTPQERVTFIGELVHAATNNPFCFDLANDLIHQGFIQGVFKNVIINPPQPSTNDSDT